MMNPGGVTLLLPYAAALTLLLLALSLQVVRLRWRHRVGLGSGQVAELERAIRVQANFCEYVPLALLLLALLAASGAASATLLHALATALLVGRVLHALGLGRSAGPSQARKIGTLLTWLVLLLAGVFGLWVGLARAFFAS